MGEASPLMDDTVDESGMPSYIYNGYGVSEDKKQNAIKFHPGMHGGLLRVEGKGGFDNSSMPFTPEGWTDSGRKYHSLSITAGADGQNVIGLRSAAGEYWEKPFRRQLTQGKHIPSLYAWLDLGG